MRIVSFERGQRRGVGALAGRGAVDVWDGVEDVVGWLEAGSPKPKSSERMKLADVHLLAPVPRPASLRDCMTFEEHIVQATRRAALKRLAPADRLLERMVGRERSVAGTLNRTFYKQPVYYKSNTRSVVGPEAEVRIPGYCEIFDYELEWAIVIGVEGADIPAKRAAEHIAGYMIFNDFSARDAQLAEMGGRLGPAKGKDFDTGNAMGPYLVTPDELADPYDLTMVARVNGAEWSRGTTRDMRWSFEQLIEHVSQSETLYPGDVLGSGTCGGGCGMEHGAFLKAGDVVELEVDGLGVLRNRVVAPRTATAAAVGSNGRPE
jgi:2-keto-4-pentenoate hydratase/2-oxohepta-3-ene-1,7-dioic acid hydratase in catechol pathway